MIKRLLINTKGQSNLSLIILITVGLVITVATLGFRKSVENFNQKSTTNIESQQYTSPSMEVKYK
ncbi:MAG: hypothetical protein IJH34_04005 [Romboutsia sp.]|nr:hypothetical protein [Romboutsia sp.]